MQACVTIARRGNVDPKFFRSVVWALNNLLLREENYNCLRQDGELKAAFFVVCHVIQQCPSLYDVVKIPLLKLARPEGTVVVHSPTPSG